MKVKLFWKVAPGRGGNNVPAFEDEINAWLSGHPRITVVEIRQSSSGGSWAPSMWFVSVSYEEGAAEASAAADRGGRG